jgi:integration host factor subunit alpha
MSKTLTKASLAQHLEEQIGLDTEHAVAMVEHFFEVIIQGLEDNQSIVLPPLGKFLVRAKNARPGRNPKTGQLIPISQRRAVVFQTGVTLKKQLSSRTFGA